MLHRSLSAALASYDRARTTLIVLAMLSILVSIVGSVWIASNITQPLSTLAQSAAQMEAGDYTGEVDVHRADEIGSLAYSLNHMREGIAEREKRILTLAYQDQLTLLPGQLDATLGAKFEHNSFSGWFVDPNVRLSWTPTNRQTLWAAVSRASRTPAQFELGGALALATSQPDPQDQEPTRLVGSTAPVSSTIGGGRGA